MQNDFQPVVDHRFTLRADWGAVDGKVLAVEPNKSLSYTVKVTFFNGMALQPLPPGESKNKDTRYLDIREEDKLDEKLLASWVRQASELPGRTFVAECL